MHKIQDGRIRMGTRTVRAVAAAMAGIAALEVADAQRALAVCPETPAECLGDAAYFLLLTESRLKLGSAILVEDGFSFWTWTTVEGDVCADRVAAISPPPASVGGYATNAGNVAVLSASGVGVTGSTVGTNGPESIGLEAGLIATGGSIVGRASPTPRWTRRGRTRSWSDAATRTPLRLPPRRLSGLSRPPRTSAT